MARLATEWVNVTGDISIIARESGRGLVSYPERHERKHRSIRDTDDRCGLGGQHGRAARRRDKSRICPNLKSASRALTRRSPAISSPWPAPITRLSTRLEISGAPPAASNELGRPDVAAYLGGACARGDRSRPARAQGSACAGCARRATRRPTFIPEGIKPLCKRFDDLCIQDYPIGCIGYSIPPWNASPRSSRRPISRRCGRCVRLTSSAATRFLRSHSSLGSEAAHVEETIEFVCLPSRE